MGQSMNEWILGYVSGTPLDLRGPTTDHQQLGKGEREPEIVCGYCRVLQKTGLRLSSELVTKGALKQFPLSVSMKSYSRGKLKRRTVYIPLQTQ